MTTPARILYFLPRLEIGGTEGQLVQLIERTDRERFEPRVGCNHLHGGFLPRLERAGIALAEFPIRSLYGARTLAQQARLVAYLRSRRIDVVLAECFYANVFAIPPARLAGTPLVIGSVREQPGHWSPAQRKVNYLALRLAHCVLTNAETVRRQLLAEGFAPERVRLVRNGIEVERYERDHGPGPLRGHLGIPEEAPLCVVVSRLVPKKGIEDFLAAAAAVARVRPDVHFVLVGDGGTVKDGQVVGTDFRSQMERRAADLGIAGRAHFLGYRLDVPEILAQSDLAAVPSLSEALSNSLIEAMASGLPVVSTDVGDHPLIIEDGVNGFIVPMGDSWAMAARMLRVLDDAGLAARLGDEARRTVHQRLSAQRMVKDMELLYEELLAGTRSPTAMRGEGATVTP
jgi:glycosyltransferase involved in cell wall biosynthesis